jgi:PST family polysaccharide transporter
MSDTQRSSSSVGFAGVTISGTVWSTGQILFNKFLTIAAIWIISRQLTQDEFGSAALAITVVKFLSVLPPLNMGDVLMLRVSRSARANRIAVVLVLKVGVITTLCLAMGSPLVASFYSQYPSSMFIGLLLVAGMRPSAEAMQVGNLTKLRMSFKNRTIALIDGGVQFASTLIAVVMALMSCGAWVIVIPPTAAVFAKAALYDVARRRSCAITSETVDVIDTNDNRTTSQTIQRHFIATSGGQYFHSIADSLPILVLGKFASESETGVYAFALSLSGQANTLVAGQIAGVLQPVLGRLADDPHRQAEGYLRTMRLISAIAIPICVVQAFFSEFIFSWVFEERWQPASHVFAVLSICEAFFFASAPTMAMLKAQGRFHTFLAWQGAQLVGSCVLLPIAALMGGGLAVAICATCLWAVGLPIAVWLSLRNSGHTIWDALRLFAIPWLTALPIGMLGWFVGSQSLVLGRGGAILATLVIAPIVLLIMLSATRWTQPAVFREMMLLVRMVIQRVWGVHRLFVGKPIG